MKEPKQMSREDVVVILLGIGAAWLAVLLDLITL